MKKFLFLLFLQSSIAISIYAGTLDQVKIVIEQDSINELEIDPYNHPNVHGDFISNGVTYSSVELNYRGAYTLSGQISSKLPYRNWKLKVPKIQPLNNRREWNFNQEENIKQWLTYYILKQAGVPCVEPKYVVLQVNNRSKYLYLMYEDVDNSDFLLEKYGNKDGDLYKSAYDTPADIYNRYWADFSYLGANNDDYFMHYDKKMSATGVANDNYGSIMEFTNKISNTPDAQFEAMIKANFAWENFIKYLVISNFTSNWDGYPHRPKNSWVYQNNETKVWNYVPWDVDATFQTWGGGPEIGLNMMGPRASIWFYMDKYEPYDRQIDETEERPLVWRMMKIPVFRNYYITEYKRAMDTYLKDTKLFQVIDSMQSVLNSNGRALGSWSIQEPKNFINTKTPLVKAELAKAVLENTGISTVNYNPINVLVSPNPAKDHFSITLNALVASNISIDVLDLTGRRIKNICQKHIDMGKQTIAVSSDDLKAGNYILSIRMKNEIITKKLMIVK